MSVTELVHFDKDGHIERNGLLKRLYLSLVIILVALLSFGLGRLTTAGQSGDIKIDFDPSLSEFQPPAGQGKPQTAAAAQSLTKSPAATESASAEVVASKNGSKYHYSYCPGAKQIKEENKITFNSAKEAEASGYVLAGNCQPR